MKVELRPWKSETDSGVRLHLWCPGCDELHGIEVGEGKPSAWGWDKNLEAPTITPSIKVSGTQWSKDQSFYRANHHVPSGGAMTCHSFVRAGRWEFLGDCTHNLAGQTVDMVELPDWILSVATPTGREGGEL